jgi:hypothetical protein
VEATLRGQIKELEEKVKEEYRAKTSVKYRLDLKISELREKLVETDSDMKELESAFRDQREHYERKQQERDAKSENVEDALYGVIKRQQKQIEVIDRALREREELVIFGHSIIKQALKQIEERDRAIKEREEYYKREQQERDARWGEVDQKQKKKRDRAIREQEDYKREQQVRDTRWRKVIEERDRAIIEQQEYYKREQQVIEARWKKVVSYYKRKQQERVAESEEVVDVFIFLINRQHKELQERVAKFEKVQGDAYGMINCLKNQLQEIKRDTREIEDTCGRLNIICAAKSYPSGTAIRQMNELENKVRRKETVETELHCSIKKLHKHLDRESAQKEEESAICGEEESANCGEEESAICGEEESANCGEEESAICGEEESANCGEEESAICGQEESAICGDVKKLVAAAVVMVVVLLIRNYGVNSG